MVSIHLVDRANAEHYGSELDQQFRLREQVFVRELGWSALTSVDGRERDQFDTPSTIYLLAIDPRIGVVGGTRLHPSLEPTLLSDVFPHLAERGFERAPDIVEWTRLYCLPSLREDNPNVTIGSLLAAVLEYCLDEGIRAIHGVGETWYLPRFIRLGWAPRPLGLEHRHEGMTLYAFRVEVNERVLARTRAFYGLDGPVLERRAGRDRVDTRGVRVRDVR